MRATIFCLYLPPLKEGPAGIFYVDQANAIFTIIFFFLPHYHAIMAWRVVVLTASWYGDERATRPIMPVARGTLFSLRARISSYVCIGRWWRTHRHSYRNSYRAPPMRKTSCNVSCAAHGMYLVSWRGAVSFQACNGTAWRAISDGWRALLKERARWHSKRCWLPSM